MGKGGYMFTRVNQRCDCCGQPIASDLESDCSKCGYPIAPEKERIFLESSIRNLRRVAAHGGATMTVTDLVQRYQTRLDVLNYQLQQVSAFTNTTAATRTEAAPKVPALQISEESMPPTPLPAQDIPSVAHDTHAHLVFSWRTFFANQTINIVASLGAFFILIGSLSFIATTTNLFLSFSVMLLVHALFGAIGIVSYRFRTFRTVSVIYTAIFALLVPLVGFSAYRLVEGQLIQLSTATLVVIAALYAALVYGFLAVYQRFAPFGYFAVSALLLADLACSQALHLNYPWWVAMLFILALPALIAAPRPGSVWPFRGSIAILRTPIQILMYIVTASSALALFLIYVLTSNSIETRFALFVASVLLLLWVILYSWLTRQKKWTIAIPYLLLVSTLFFCYMLAFTQIGYAIALTVLALAYHLLQRLATPLLRHVEQTVMHMEGIILALVGAIPLLLTPDTFLILFIRSLGFQTASQLGRSDTFTALFLQCIGLVITLSVLFSHTGIKRSLSTQATHWTWLLLLAGWQLDMSYGLAVVQLQLSPFWSFLALALLLLASAVLIRRFVGSAWANMLDIVAWANIAITLLFSLRQPHIVIASTLLGFAVLTYAIVVYQQRSALLFFPLTFVLLALPLLNEYIGTTLLLAALLPLVAAAIRLSITNKRTHQIALTLTENLEIPTPRGADKEHPEQTESMPTPPVRSSTLALSLAWEWPLLATAMTLGVVILLHDFNLGTQSVVQQGFGLAWPIEVELGGLALSWYIAAGLARRAWWLGATYTLLLIALLMTTTFWVFAWVAPLALLAALAIRRRVSMQWAGPLYAASALAALSVGYYGFAEPYRLFALWELAGYAMFAYTAGIIEDNIAFQWVSPVFTAWSAMLALVQGQHMLAFGLGLLFAILGMGTHMLKQITSKFEAQGRRFALPLYGNTLAVAAILVFYGILAQRAQLNQPFYAALPVMLLIYAVLAFVVSAFEQRPRWLWLTPVLGLIAVVLLPTTVTCFANPGYTANLCYVQLLTTTYLLVGVALATGIAGILAGNLLTRGQEQVNTLTALQRTRSHFTWSWPWYALSYSAIIVTLYWDENVGSLVVHGTLGYTILASFIILACIEMMLEHTPEMIIVPALLATWLISVLPWMLWQQMLGYSALCVAVFGAQYIWEFLPVNVSLIAPKHLYAWLSIGGQIVVIASIVEMGGLSPTVGILAHTGSSTLLILALLVLWHGYLQSPEVRHWHIYGSGFLISLSLSWELLALGQTGIDVLTLAPATYLVVIAPFVSHDRHVHNRQHLGQFCAIAGSLLLLLPMTWMSFTHDNLQPTLFLAGESLVLLLLGIVTRLRFFLLSGAAMVIIATIHALFLPSLGIPLSIALALLGAILLGLATTLSLMRQRLRTVWSELE